ncbi:hypothetical protein V5799_000813 [Amblyomma americanum]|uniref:Uncharacterized protein n=1 Tax=Amblyomma americanum TaxID=6943 RepID=A0AAQ4D1Z5_AMBAM
MVTTTITILRIHSTLPGGIRFMPETTRRADQGQKLPVQIKGREPGLGRELSKEADGLQPKQPDCPAVRYAFCTSSTEFVTADTRATKTRAFGLLASAHASPPLPRSATY